MKDARLDPEVQALLDEIEAAGGPRLSSMSPEEARRAAVEGLRPLSGELVPLSFVEDLKIPGPLGSIPIRVYRPHGSGSKAALLYFHGGGWVVCDLDSHATVCARLAAESGAIVIAVDYRLAPEHRFPAAVIDSYAALQWVAANASRLGIDAHHICVGGDSAGGNLATVLALKARDEGGPAIALQVLVYPVTNLADFDTPSYSEFATGYHLSLDSMEWFRAHYMGPDGNARHPGASPALAEDLRGLPPALVITAECDVLRDEGEAYAERMRDAGVAVVLTRYAGMVHPFFSMPGRIRQSREAISEVAAAVRLAYSV